MILAFFLHIRTRKLSGICYPIVRTLICPKSPPGFDRLYRPSRDGGVTKRVRQLRAITKYIFIYSSQFKGGGVS